MAPDSLKDLAATLIAKLGLEADDIVVTAGYRTLVAITTAKHSKELIGPQGEHLRALNSLLRRLVEQQHGAEAANFLVDVNDYNEKKLEQVRDSARMLAQRARLFKHDVELNPMSPYERLVIHELFAQDPEIETRSEGEGKFRHIVLHYRAGQGAPSEPAR